MNILPFTFNIKYHFVFTKILISALLLDNIQFPKKILISTFNIKYPSFFIKIGTQNINYPSFFIKIGMVDSFIHFTLNGSLLLRILEPLFSRSQASIVLKPHSQKSKLNSVDGSLVSRESRWVGPCRTPFIYSI